MARTTKLVPIYQTRSVARRGRQTPSSNLLGSSQDGARMGNNSSRESRGNDSAPHGYQASTSHGRSAPAHDSRPGGLQAQSDGHSSVRNRISRGDLSMMLRLGSSSGAAPDSNSDQPTPEQRRETKQEREARRLERERVARIKERERSLREEHVDGGYLVTLGTYVGPEDFNKQIVRQLQVSSP